MLIILRYCLDEYFQSNASIYVDVYIIMTFICWYFVFPSFFNRSYTPDNGDDNTSDNSIEFIPTKKKVHFEDEIDSISSTESNSSVSDLSSSWFSGLVDMLNSMFS